VTTPGRAPRTDAEFARNVVARLRVLEQARAVQVGPWTIFERGGELLAAEPGGQLLNLSTPDLPESVDLSGLVSRDEMQTLVNGAVLSQFDTLYQALAGLVTPQQALSPLTALLTGELAKITSLLGVFGGATTVGQAESFITNLLGAFGGASTIGQVETFVTNLIGAFGGATTTGGAQTFVSDLLTSLFGVASIGSTIQTDAVPTLPQSKITGLATALANLLPTTDFNSLLTNLFGIASIGSTIQTGAVPTLPQSKISGLTSALASLVSGTTFDSLLTSLFGGTSIGSTIQTSAVPTLPSSKVTDLPALFTDVTEIPARMLDAWFGGTSGTGDVTEVTTTIEAIRTTVTGGFTLQTFTSSNASWAVPDSLANASEAYAFAINGGQRGGQGTGAGFITPGQGGVNGGYRSEPIDPSTLAATLAVTVGAGGATSLAVGGQSKIMSGATTLVQALAGVGSIGTKQGYIDTTSTPGDGGDGGNGATGQSGTGNAFASGGAGGAYNGAFSNGSPGQPGGAGQYTTTPLAGGGGGGGGGGHNGSTRSGGAGGNGGFPGGASGGAGSSSGPNPQPGTAGNGLCALIWR
jgi:hypothetical protein